METKYIVFTISGIVFLGCFILSIIYDTRKENEYIRRLQVGTRLQICYNIIDEFDPELTFTVTVIKRGKKQVRVRWSDGTETTENMKHLYYNGWKILD